MGRPRLGLLERLRRRSAGGRPGVPREAVRLGLALALVLFGLLLARSPAPWAASLRAQALALARVDTAPAWGRSLAAAWRSLDLARVPGAPALPADAPAVPSDALPTGLGRLVWPVVGALVSGFGFRDGTDGPEYHEGVDIAGEASAPVRAVAAGRVVAVGPAQAGVGLAVTLAHDFGWTTVYAHMGSVQVAPGQAVAAGQVLGRLAPGGDDGRSRGAVLHFELREDGKPLDPAPYLGLAVGAGP
ncbi:MAG: M23 family metallopeptidase [Clostridia bacterium]|nr:M23 family metallopeptidase [Clostridia bacterium]